GDGPGATGLDPKPAVLAGLEHMRIATDGFYFWTISEGGIQFNGAMPPFKGQIKDEDIWKIVLFLRTL
ncbi:MAG: c-type cytochrome, partial [Sphingomonadaceae bacterium]